MSFWDINHFIFLYFDGDSFHWIIGGGGWVSFWSSPGELQFNVLFHINHAPPITQHNNNTFAQSLIVNITDKSKSVIIQNHIAKFIYFWLNP